MSSIEGAIRFAAHLHDGQTDKNGDPYVLHPLRVMENAASIALAWGVDQEDARIIGVLHDVVEDCECTHEDVVYALRLTPELSEALEAITHLKNEPYQTYLERVVTNPIATVVKLADLEDNTNPLRQARLPEDVQARMKVKYDGAYDFINDKLNRQVVPGLDYMSYV